MVASVGFKVAMCKVETSVLASSKQQSMHGFFYFLKKRLVALAALSVAGKTDLLVVTMM